MHYNSKFNDGHAVTAEQKIRELKNCLKNFKRLLEREKIKPNEALRKATVNMNIFSTKNMAFHSRRRKKNHSSLKNIKWIAILSA